MNMPYRRYAYVEDQKLYGYLLNRNAKGADFLAFGFTVEDAHFLKSLLLSIAYDRDFRQSRETPHGRMYDFYEWVLSPTNREVPLFRTWQVAHGKRSPRLITAYPTWKYQRKFPL